MAAMWGPSSRGVLLVHNVGVEAALLPNPPALRRPSSEMRPLPRSIIGIPKFYLIRNYIRR